MQKITPNLWFQGNAEEAVDFYTAVFRGGKVNRKDYYPNSAAEGLADFQTDFAGKVLAIDFTLGDLSFTAINAGTEFTINPSISFMVNFDPAREDDARQYMDEVWAQLSDGGEARMPLGEYDFSEHYGWVQDRYGVNWQLILTDPTGEPRPFMMPALMFAGQSLGRADEARQYYAEVFDDSKLGTEARYPQTTEDFTEGHLMFSDLQLAGQWFVMNDGGPKQDFTFNEGVSLAIACRDQAEIDYFWGELSTVPEAEICGWCKDQFGVSWQVIPANMAELMQRPGAYATLMEQSKIIVDEY